ncbi:MAG: antibiotic biosynthesis monooxygenase family protein [Pseudomonadota bacterium]
MIYEIATITIKPGAESAFEQAVADAAKFFQADTNCHSLKLERIIERPSTYRLVVGWTSVEAHMVTFRESDNFQRWREVAGPHFAAPPEVEHVEVVVTGF